MQMNDAILKQVRTTIDRGAHFDRHAWPIAMSFQDGTLLLDGELPQISAKKKALRAASSVAGVHRIVDRLRVGRLNGGGGDSLRDAVCKRMLEQIDFRNCHVHISNGSRQLMLRDAGHDASGSIAVSAQEGVVTLTGHVISLSHKRLAGTLAWWCGGCRDVINALMVVPGEADNDDEIVDALRLTLEVDPYVHADYVSVTASNRVVTLDGSVGSEGERERVEMDAWTMYAIDGVINRIRIH